MISIDPWLSNVLHIALTAGFLLYLYRLSEVYHD